MYDLSPKIINGSKKIKKISRNTKLLINILSSCLVFFFGFLKLHDIPFAHFSDTVSIQIIFHLLLSMYFFSWVLGTNFDLSYQEDVYVDIPYDGKIPWHGIITSISIALVFAMLCLVNSIESFSILLFIFWLINMISWIYYVKYFQRPAYKASKNIYLKLGDIMHLEILEIIYNYIFGTWQKIRFIFGFILLLSLNIITFTKIKNYLANYFKFKTNEFVLLIAVVIVISILESWIWYERIKTKIRKDYIEQLQRQYLFKKRERPTNRLS